MTKSADKPLNLTDFALVLDARQQVHALPAGPELYPQLAAQFGHCAGFCRLRRAGGGGRAAATQIADSR
jgi:hypothetical protein